MKNLVKFGIFLNIIIAIGHLLCMIDLNKMFVIYGINDVMNEIARYGAFVPYAITIAIAVAFFVIALYGMSALKIIKRLPLQNTAIVVIIVVFLGRVVWGLTMLIPHFTWLEFSSSAVALLLGVCYLPCLCLNKKQH